MRSGLILLCLAALCAAGPVSAQPPALAGLVVDDSTGAPIRGARVLVLPGRRHAATDEAGRFSIARLPTGPYMVEVQALGFAPARGGVRVDRGGLVLEVRLPPAAITLDTVTVAATRAGTRRDASGFERRRLRHTGSGRFFDRALLESRGASQLSDIFGGIPGVRIVRAADGSVYAATASSQPPGSFDPTAGRPCFTQVYVDGVRQSGAGGPLDLRSYSPSSLESAEFYRHPSSTPVEFRTGRPECGTLVLWTRRPVRERSVPRPPADEPRDDDGGGLDEAGRSP
jgi:hypothetical protein